ncbi:unnamed protein product [Lactuca saligna]|uniref:Uncharacterized protein n=1 Tax=Lactuca saligna TaxID=75948 RepID=A0AA36E3C2_LACSI|nr:unnamed protein product [Lactuca saligna]
MPCLNPYGWIMVLHLLIKDEKKYEPKVDHIKRMLISYIHEAIKMDVEIALMLRKKQIFLLKDSTKDIEKMKMGRIEKDNWSVMFQRGSKERGDKKKCVFLLPYKHLFSTTSLNYVLEITGSCKENDDAANKSYSYMIRWYISIWSTLLSIMPKLFKMQKPTQL